MRLMALALIFTFISEPLSYAQTADLSLKVPGEISIPGKWGKIDEKFLAPNRKTVIYIQDAHDSLEAQNHIAKLITHFVDKEDVRTVLEEGYEGLVPTDSFFDFIPDPAIKEKVSYFLLDKLRIGGAEYAHINRKKDFKLLGADNIKLHLKNIQKYRDFSKQREQTQKDLAKLAQEIETLASRAFPKPMKEWLRSRRKFEAGEMNLLDYLQRTAAVLKKDALRDWPMIGLLLAAAQTKDGEIPDALKNLNPQVLFEEITILEDRAAEQWVLDPTGRQIFQYQRQIELLQRLGNIEISASEYEAVKNTLASIQTQKIAEFIARQADKPVLLSKRWEKAIRDAVDFYEIAHERNGAISKSLEGFLKSDEKTAVLVFGGFHREAIREILKDKKISFYVVTPRMSGADREHQEFYKHLMSRGAHAFEIPHFVKTAARAEAIFEMGLDSTDSFRRQLTSSVERHPNLPMPLLIQRVTRDLETSAGISTQPRAEVRIDYAPTKPQQQDLQRWFGSSSAVSIDEEGRFIETTEYLNPFPLFPADEQSRINRMNELFGIATGGIGPIATDKHPGGIFQPSALWRAVRALRAAGIKPGQLIADLGHGDGRVPSILAHLLQARLTGAEWDTTRYRQSEAAREIYEKQLFLRPGQVHFENGDFNELDISQADYVYYYSFGAPKDSLNIERIMKEMKPGAKFILLGVKVDDDEFTRQTNEYQDPSVLLDSDLFELQRYPEIGAWIFTKKETAERLKPSVRSEIRNVEQPGGLKWVKDDELQLTEKLIAALDRKIIKWTDKEGVPHTASLDFSSQVVEYFPGFRDTESVMTVIPTTEELKKSWALRYLDTAGRMRLLPRRGSFGNFIFRELSWNGEPVLVINQIQSSPGFHNLRFSGLMNFARKMLKIKGINWQQRYGPWKNSALEVLTQTAKEAGYGHVFVFSHREIRRQNPGKKSGAVESLSDASLYEHYIRPFDKTWEKIKLPYVNEGIREFRHKDLRSEIRTAALDLLIWDNDPDSERDPLMAQKLKDKKIEWFDGSGNPRHANINFERVPYFLEDQESISEEEFYLTIRPGQEELKNPALEVLDTKGRLGGLPVPGSFGNIVYRKALWGNAPAIWVRQIQSSPGFHMLSAEEKKKYGHWKDTVLKVLIQAAKEAGYEHIFVDSYETIRWLNKNAEGGKVSSITPESLYEHYIRPFRGRWDKIRIPFRYKTNDLFFWHKDLTRAEVRSAGPEIFVEIPPDMTFDFDAISRAQTQAAIRDFLTAKNHRNLKKILKKLDGETKKFEDLTQVASVEFQHGQFLQIFLTVLVFKDGDMRAFILNVPAQTRTNASTLKDYEGIRRLYPRIPQYLVKPLLAGTGMPEDFVFEGEDGFILKAEPLNIFALEYLGDYVELAAHFHRKNPDLYFNNYRRQDEPIGRVRAARSRGNQKELFNQVFKILTAAAIFNPKMETVDYPDDVRLPAGDFMVRAFSDGHFNLKLITVRSWTENKKLSDFWDYLFHSRFLERNPRWALEGIAQGLAEKFGRKKGEAYFRKWMQEYEQILEKRLSEHWEKRAPAVTRQLYHKKNIYDFKWLNRFRDNKSYDPRDIFVGEIEAVQKFLKNWELTRPLIKFVIRKERTRQMLVRKTIRQALAKDFDELLNATGVLKLAGETEGLPEYRAEIRTKSSGIFDAKEFLKRKQTLEKISKDILSAMPADLTPLVTAGDLVQMVHHDYRRDYFPKGAAANVVKKKIDPLRERLKLFFLNEDFPDSIEALFDPKVLREGLRAAGEMIPELKSDFRESIKENGRQRFLILNGKYVSMPVEYAREVPVTWTRFGYRNSHFGLLQDEDHPENFIVFQEFKGRIYTAGPGDKKLRRLSLRGADRSKSMAGDAAFKQFDRQVLKPEQVDDDIRHRTLGFANLAVYLSAKDDQKIHVRRKNGKRYGAGETLFFEDHTAGVPKTLMVLEHYPGKQKAFTIRGLGWRFKKTRKVYPLVLAQRSRNPDKGFFNLNRIADMVRDGHLQKQLARQDAVLVVGPAFNLSSVASANYVGESPEGAEHNLRVSLYKIGSWKFDRDNPLRLYPNGTTVGAPDGARAEIRSRAISSQTPGALVYGRTLFFKPEIYSYVQELFEPALKLPEADSAEDEKAQEILDAAIHRWGILAQNNETLKAQYERFKKKTIVAGIDYPHIFFHTGTEATRVLQMSFWRRLVMLPKKFLASMDVHDPSDLNLVITYLYLGQSLLDNYEKQLRDLNPEYLTQEKIAVAVQSIHRSLDQTLAMMGIPMFLGGTDVGVMTQRLRDLVVEDRRSRRTAAANVPAFEKQIAPILSKIRKILGDWTEAGYIIPEVLEKSARLCREVFGMKPTPSVPQMEAVQKLLSLVRVLKQMAAHYEERGVTERAVKIRNAALELMRDVQKIDQGGHAPVRIQQEMIHYTIRSGDLEGFIREFQILKEKRYIPRILMKERDGMHEFNYPVWLRRAAPAFLMKLETFRQDADYRSRQSLIESAHKMVMNEYRKLFNEDAVRGSFDIDLKRQAEDELKKPVMIFPKNSYDAIAFRWRKEKISEDEIRVAVEAFMPISESEASEPFGFLKFTLKKNASGEWVAELTDDEDYEVDPVMVEKYGGSIGSALIRLSMRLAAYSGAESLTLAATAQKYGSLHIKLMRRRKSVPAPVYSNVVFTNLKQHPMTLEAVSLRKRSEIRAEVSPDDLGDRILQKLKAFAISSTEMLKRIPREHGEILEDLEIEDSGRGPVSFEAVETVQREFLEITTLYDDFVERASARDQARVNEFGYMLKRAGEQLQRLTDNEGGRAEIRSKADEHRASRAAYIKKLQKSVRRTERLSQAAAEGLHEIFSAALLANGMLNLQRPAQSGFSPRHLDEMRRYIRDWKQSSVILPGGSRLRITFVPTEADNVQGILLLQQDEQMIGYSLFSMIYSGHLTEINVGTDIFKPFRGQKTPDGKSLTQEILSLIMARLANEGKPDNFRIYASNAVFDDLHVGVSDGAEKNAAFYLQAGFYPERLKDKADELLESILADGRISAEQAQSLRQPFWTLPFSNVRPEIRSFFMEPELTEKEISDLSKLSPKGLANLMQPFLESVKIGEPRINLERIKYRMLFILVSPVLSVLYNFWDAVSYKTRVTSKIKNFTERLESKNRQDSLWARKKLINILLEALAQKKNMWARAVAYEILAVIAREIPDLEFEIKIILRDIYAEGAPWEKAKENPAFNPEIFDMRVAEDGSDRMRPLHYQIIYQEGRRQERLQNFNDPDYQGFRMAVAKARENNQRSIHLGQLAFDYGINFYSLEGRKRVAGVLKRFEYTVGPRNLELPSGPVYHRSEIRSGKKEAAKKSGWLAEELGLSQDQILERLNRADIKWNMKKVNTLLRAEFPGRVPHINTINGAVGVAVALGVDSLYRQKIEQVIDESFGYIGFAVEKLTVARDELPKVYADLTKLQDGKAKKLSEIPLTAGRLLPLIAEKIKDFQFTGKHQEQISGRPHWIYTLSQVLRESDTPDAEKPALIQKHIQQWLETPDPEGKTWPLPLLRLQLMELFPEYDFPQFDWALILWGLNLSEAFEKEYEMRADRFAGSMRTVGGSFGLSTNGQRDLTLILSRFADFNSRGKEPAEDDYTAVPRMAGQLNLSRTRFLEALSTELGRTISSDDVLDELNAPDLDWNLPKFFEKHPSISWLKLRGYKAFFQAAGIEFQARAKMRERYEYYGGLIAAGESFGLNYKVAGVLYASMGLPAKLLQVRRGNLLKTFGVTKEQMLARMTASKWKDLPLLKEELIRKFNEEQRVKGKPLLPLNQKDFGIPVMVWGLDLSDEFLAELKKRQEAGKTLYQIARSFGLKGSKQSVSTNFSGVLKRLQAKIENEKNIPVIFDSKDLETVLRLFAWKNPYGSARVLRRDKVWETMPSPIAFDGNGGIDNFVLASKRKVIQSAQYPYRWRIQNERLEIESVPRSEIRTGNYPEPDYDGFEAKVKEISQRPGSPSIYLGHLAGVYGLSVRDNRVYDILATYGYINGPLGGEMGAPIWAKSQRAEIRVKKADQIRERIKELHKEFTAELTKKPWFFFGASFRAGHLESEMEKIFMGLNSLLIHQTEYAQNTLDLEKVQNAYEKMIVILKVLQKLHGKSLNPYDAKPAEIPGGFGKVFNYRFDMDGITYDLHILGRSKLPAADHPLRYSIDIKRDGNHFDGLRFDWNRPNRENNREFVSLDFPDSIRALSKNQLVLHSAAIKTFHNAAEFSAFIEEMNHRSEFSAVPAETRPEIRLLAEKAEDMQIYQINSRAYFKEKKISDFSKFTDRRLKKIAASGYNTIWLTGIWAESPKSREINEFWGGKEGEKRVPSAYAIPGYDVNSAIGTEDQLRDLVRRANKLGIRIMLDFIPNHFSMDSPLIDQHPDWFVHRRTLPEGGDEDLRYFKHELSGGRGTIWVAHGRDSYYPGRLPWGDTAQLNFLNPEVWDFMEKELNRISDLNNGNGIRFDAIDAINPEYYLALWREELAAMGYADEAAYRSYKPIFKALKKRLPQFVSLGEGFLVQDIGYWEKQGFDLLYGQNFYRKLFPSKGRADWKWIKRYALREARSARLPLLYLENHDYSSRVAEHVRQALEKQTTDERDILALTGLYASLIGTLIGVPLVYQGQEDGKRRQGPDAIRLRESSEKGRSHYQKMYQKLFLLTKRPAFRRGGPPKLIPFAPESEEPESVLAFKREGEKETGIVVMNHSDKPVTFTLDFRKAWLGVKNPVITLQPWESRVWVIDSKIKHLIFGKFSSRANPENYLTKADKKRIKKSYHGGMQREGAGVAEEKPVRIFSDLDAQAPLIADLFDDSRAEPLNSEFYKGKKVLVAPGNGGLPFIFSARGAREVVGLDLDPITIAWQKLKMQIGQEIYGELLQASETSRPMVHAHYLSQWFNYLNITSPFPEIDGLSFRKGNILEPIPYQNNEKYDLIVVPFLFGFEHGLETKEQWDKALENMKKVLAPGGRILLLPGQVDTASWKLESEHKDRIDRVILGAYQEWLAGLNDEKWNITHSQLYPFYTMANRLAGYTVLTPRSEIRTAAPNMKEKAVAVQRAEEAPKDTQTEVEAPVKLQGRFDYDAVAKVIFELFSKNPKRVRMPGHVELQGLTGISKHILGDRAVGIRVSLLGLAEESPEVLSRIRFALLIDENREMAVIEYLIRYFSDPVNAEAKEFPSSQKIARVLDLDHKTVRPDEMLKALNILELKLPELVSDAVLRQRLERASELYRDFEGNVADFVVDAFADPNRVLFPSNEEIAEAFGRSQENIRQRILPKVFPLLEEKINTKGFSPGLRGRIVRALWAHEDITVVTAYVILKRFENDPRLEKMPSMDEFSTELGKNDRTLGAHWEQILEVLETVLRRRPLDAGVKQRMTSAIQSWRSQYGGRKKEIKSKGNRREEYDFDKTVRTLESILDSDQRFQSANRAGYETKTIGETLIRSARKGEAAAVGRAVDLLINDAETDLHPYAVTALRSFPDKPQVKRVLASVTASMPETITRGGWYKLAAFLKQNDPERYDRYWEMTKLTVIADLMPEYLESLFPRVERGEAAAVKIWDRILRAQKELLERGKDKERDYRADGQPYLVPGRRVDEALGLVLRHRTTHSKEIAEKIGLNKKSVEDYLFGVTAKGAYEPGAYDVLAAYFLAESPEVIEDMQRAMENSMPRFVMETMVGFFEKPPAGSALDAAKEKRALLEALEKTAVEETGEVAERWKRVLGEKIQNPKRAITSEETHSVYGFVQRVIGRMDMVNRISRLLMADPEEGEPVPVRIRDSFLSQATVHIGHFVYSKRGGKQIRENFDPSKHSRVRPFYLNSAELEVEYRVQKVIALVLSRYGQTGVFPALEELETLKGGHLNFWSRDLRLIREGLRNRGFVFSDRDWFVISQETQTAPPASLLFDESTRVAKLGETVVHLGAENQEQADFLGMRITGIRDFVKLIEETRGVFMERLDFFLTAQGLQVYAEYRDSFGAQGHDLYSLRLRRNAVPEGVDPSSASWPLLEILKAQGFALPLHEDRPGQSLTVDGKTYSTESYYRQLGKIPGEIQFFISSRDDGSGQIEIREAYGPRRLLGTIEVIPASGESLGNVRDTRTVLEITISPVNGYVSLGVNGQTTEMNARYRAKEILNYWGLKTEDARGIVYRNSEGKYRFALRTLRAGELKERTLIDFEIDAKGNPVGIPEIKENQTLYSLMNLALKSGTIDPALYKLTLSKNPTGKTLIDSPDIYQKLQEMTLRMDVYIPAKSEDAAFENLRLRGWHAYWIRQAELRLRRKIPDYLAPVLGLKKNQEEGTIDIYIFVEKGGKLTAVKRDSIMMPAIEAVSGRSTISIEELFKKQKSVRTKPVDRFQTFSLNHDNYSLRSFLRQPVFVKAGIIPQDVQVILHEEASNSRIEIAVKGFSVQIINLGDDLKPLVMTDKNYRTTYSIMNLLKRQKKAVENGDARFFKTDLVFVNTRLGFSRLASLEDAQDELKRREALNLENSAEALQEPRYKGGDPYLLKFIRDWNRRHPYSPIVIKQAAPNWSVQGPAAVWKNQTENYTGLDNAERERLWHAGDFNAVVESFIPAVNQYARHWAMWTSGRKFRREKDQNEEMNFIQTGNLIVVEAVREWKPENGNTLTAFVEARLNENIKKIARLDHHPYGWLELDAPFDANDDDGSLTGLLEAGLSPGGREDEEGLGLDLLARIEELAKSTRIPAEQDVKEGFESEKNEKTEPPASQEPATEPVKTEDPVEAAIEPTVIVPTALIEPLREDVVREVVNNRDKSSGLQYVSYDEKHELARELEKWFEGQGLQAYLKRLGVGHFSMHMMGSLGKLGSAIKGYHDLNLMIVTDADEYDTEAVMDWIRDKTGGYYQNQDLRGKASLAVGKNGDFEEVLEAGPGSFGELLRKHGVYSRVRGLASIESVSFGSVKHSFWEDIEAQREKIQARARRRAAFNLAYADPRWPENGVNGILVFENQTGAARHLAELSHKHADDDEIREYFEDFLAQTNEKLRALQRAQVNRFSETPDEAVSFLGHRIGKGRIDYDIRQIEGLGIFLENANGSSQGKQPQFLFVDGQRYLEGRLSGADRRNEAYAKQVERTLSENGGDFQSIVFHNVNGSSHTLAGTLGTKRKLPPVVYLSEPLQDNASSAFASIIQLEGMQAAVIVPEKIKVKEGQKHRESVSEPQAWKNVAVQTAEPENDPKPAKKKSSGMKPDERAALLRQLLDEEKFSEAAVHFQILNAKRDRFPKHHELLDHASRVLNRSELRKAFVPSVEPDRQIFENKRILVDYRDLVTDEQIKEIIYTAQQPHRNVQVLISNVNQSEKLGKLFESLQSEQLIVKPWTMEEMARKYAKDFKGEVVVLAGSRSGIQAQRLKQQLKEAAGIRQSFVLGYEENQNGSLGVALRDLENRMLRHKGDTDEIVKPAYMALENEILRITDREQAGIDTWQHAYHQALVVARNA